MPFVCLWQMAKSVSGAGTSARISVAMNGTRNSVGAVPIMSMVPANAGLLPDNDQPDNDLPVTICLKQYA